MNGWTGMTRADFDKDASTVQGALIPAPDPAGTGDLFDQVECDELCGDDHR